MNAPRDTPKRAGHDVVLRMSGIRKHFGGNVVLDGVDAELPRGQVVLLRGENGSGKTTLLNILTGNLEPDAGRVEVHAKGAWTRFEFPPRGWHRFVPGLGFSPNRIAQAGVGRTWQDTRLFPRLDLQSNVAAAAPGQLGERLGGALFRPWASRLSEARNLHESRALLAELGIGDRAQSSGDRISLGQSKRVAIARAIHAGARVLFLDEPFAGLDAAGVDQAVEYLRHLARNHGITMVIVEHVFHIARVLSFADTVWTLAGGRLTFETPGEVGAENVASVAPHDAIDQWLREIAGDAGAVTEEPLPGGAVLLKVAPTGGGPGGLGLELRNIVVGHRPGKVVSWTSSGTPQGLQLRLRQGELGVLFAPNGWGKTTLMNAIAGVGHVESGSIALDGEILNPLPAWSRAGRGVRYARARHGGFDSLSAAENWALARSSMTDEAGAWPRRRAVGSLSGGERQRLNVSMALNAPHAKLLLLDEPFSALDAAQGEAIKAMIVAASRSAATLVAMPRQRS